MVGVAALLNDPRRIEGSLPQARVTVPLDAQGVRPGEWHAYGRTGYGQRYSPLDQISPANAAQLQTAWSYQTGDSRGRPGDPVATTFDVTPLKIGDRLFLCTPHQSVIALDADSGREIWRYNPRI
jgi:quinoprotein glucose dehydrogenase